ncbi:hypothetical protein BD309DRAFT_260922 [Dichomitus squalens]|nr:hypothetical protein BD309DRAFT_260922 [Dichomitus squalens]
MLYPSASSPSVTPHTARLRLCLPRARAFLPWSMQPVYWYYHDPRAVPLTNTPSWSPARSPPEAGYGPSAMVPWPWGAAGYCPHYPPNFLSNGVRPSVPQQPIIHGQPAPVIDHVPIHEDSGPRYPLSVLSQSPNLHPVVERLLLAIPRPRASSRWSPQDDPFRPFAEAGVDLSAPELRAALDEPAVPEWQTVFGRDAPRRHVFPSIRVVFSPLGEYGALVVSIRVTRGHYYVAGYVSGVSCRPVENEPATVKDFLYGLWRGLTEDLGLESDEGRGIPSGWMSKAVRSANRQSPEGGPAASSSSLGDKLRVRRIDFLSGVRFSSVETYGPRIATQAAGRTPILEVVVRRAESSRGFS